MNGVKLLGFVFVVLLLVALPVLGEAPVVYETGSPAPTMAEVEPNAAYANATSIALGDVVSGRIGFAGDRDTFLFAPPASTTYLIDLDAEAIGSALDAAVCVYDATYVPPAEIACNDNSNGLDSLVYSYTASPVYIRVTDANHPHEGGPAYGYKLSVYRPFLVSAATNGTVDGVPFAAADVLAHHDFSDGTERWMLFFDASDVGLTRNLVALDAPDGGGQGLRFALDGAQMLPVYDPTTGEYPPQRVRPQDALVFTPALRGSPEPYGQFGPTTAGRFFMDTRGADVGLTTAGEKIDALGGGTSTAGRAGYPSGLVAEDEDVVEVYAGRLAFDGSLVPGLAAEDVVGADATSWNHDRLVYDRYLLVIKGRGRVAGLAVSQREIFAVDPQTDEVAGFYWRGPAHHFNNAIDAFDAVDPFEQ